MPEKNFYLTPVESKKQQLLLTSELNRVQLLIELDEFSNEIRQVRDHVHAIGSMASSAAKLATTFSAIGNAFTHHDDGEKKKSSWVSTLLKGARTGASIWVALRSQLK